MDKKKKKFPVTPALLVMLVVSATMWYLTQLSKTYDGVRVPVEVSVGEENFEVDCIATGVGFRLAAHRTFNKTHVTIARKELKIEEADSTGMGMINPETLQTAINQRISDIRVMRIDTIPEVAFNRL